MPLLAPIPFWLVIVLLCSGCIGAQYRFGRAHAFEPSGPYVVQMAASSGGRLVVAALRERDSPDSVPAAYHWDMTARRLQARYTGVTAVAVSPDGMLAAHGMADGRVQILDVRTDQIRFSERAHPAGRISAVRISSDATMLAAAGSDDRIVVWRIAGAEVIHSLQMSNTVLSVEFSPDGRYIAAGDFSQRLTVCALENQEPGLDVRGNAPLTALAFSSDGKLLAVGYYREAIVVYKIPSGETVLSLGPRNEDGCSVSADAVSFNPEGSCLANIAHMSNIEIRDLATGKRIKTLFWGRWNADRACFTPDGDMAVYSAYVTTCPPVLVPLPKHVWRPRQDTQRRERPAGTPLAADEREADAPPSTTAPD